MYFEHMLAYGLGICSFFLKKKDKLDLHSSIYHQICNVPQSFNLVNAPYRSTIGIAMSISQFKMTKIPYI